MPTHLHSPADSLFKRMSPAAQHQASVTVIMPEEAELHGKVQKWTIDVDKVVGPIEYDDSTVESTQYDLGCHDFMITIDAGGLPTGMYKAEEFDLKDVKNKALKFKAALQQQQKVLDLESTDTRHGCHMNLRFEVCR